MVEWENAQLHSRRLALAFHPEGVHSKGERTGIPELLSSPRTTRSGSLLGRSWLVQSKRILSPGLEAEDGPSNHSHLGIWGEDAITI